MSRPAKSPDSPISWGNELYMRERIKTRRTVCSALRRRGFKWSHIASFLGYGSAAHARIDWLRGQA